MRIQSLEAYGVPTQLLTVWETALSDTLLPIQQQAVVQHQVLTGNNLIVQAPTSSGKTFIGEMAATQAAWQGRRALCLVPTRALAEEKWRYFSDLYGPLGLRVAISTREHTVDDRRLASGDYDLAVSVPEKVRALWGRNSGLCATLGLVVVDELQHLSDPQRGPCLELLLADLRQLPNLQIIGLSACLGASPALAEYLRADWQETRQRPVELRKGVCLEGEFRYVEHNSGEWHSEILAEPTLTTGDWGEAAVSLATQFARRGEQTLVFVRDRAAALRLACELAERLPEASATDALNGLEPTAVRARLKHLLGHGVAFHSTDLQYEDRRVVEQAFRAREVQVICATPTLALGVNLPARNVLLDPEGWHNEHPGQAAALSPISRAQFENRAGRAGRLGYHPFGRAILLADCELTRATLTHRYLQGPMETARPALAEMPPAEALLRLAATPSTSRGTTLRRAYAESFSARFEGQGELPPAWRTAAAGLVEEGFLRALPDGDWAATPMGRLAAASGVCCETFRWLTTLVTQAPHAPSDLALLWLLCQCAEVQGELPPPPGRPQRADFVVELQTVAEETGHLLEDWVGILAAQQGDYRGRQHAAHLALMLRQWLGEAETLEVEEATRLTAARLSNLGEMAGWLGGTLADIGAERGWPANDLQRLRDLARRLPHGLPAEGLAWAGFRQPQLGRDHVRKLVAAGFFGPQDLAGALPQGLPPDLPAWLRGETQMTTGQAAEPATPPAPPLVSPPAPEPEGENWALVLEDDRPDRALLFGSSVTLRPAEYRLLRALAEAPGKCIRYETLYRYLWTEDCFVEPGQLYSHRSRLSRRLAQAAPQVDVKSLLVTVPKHGLRLNLRPEEVRVC